MLSAPDATPMGENGEQLKWVDLESRSIASVAYDSEKYNLYVRFSTDDTWMYTDVPKQKFKSLVFAGSSGSYLRKEIIPHYEGKKLDDGNDRSTERNNPTSVSGPNVST